jgi:hypothetical protein
MSSSSNGFHKGQEVKWNWAGNDAYGKVSEKFERAVQRTLKGTKVKKNGSKENPAYLIEQDDGDQVLKLASELKEA